MSSETRPARLRTRWSAVGAAVAITLGAGGIGLADASVGTGEKAVTITIEPERILDTRVDLGLAGAFASDAPRDLQVTGSVPVASGGSESVVPAGAAAVIVNVTVVDPTADGFVSLRPGGAAGSPSTSTVNFTPGSVEPNAATVDLSADGKIQIWVFLLGVASTAEVLVDVVGYTVDHHHDDRYYPQDQTYSQDEADAMFQAHGEITLRHSTSELTANFADPPTTISSAGGGSTITGDGTVNLNLTGPAVISGVPYGLESVEFCIANIFDGALIDHLTVASNTPVGSVASDPTDRTANGCYTVQVDHSSAFAYDVLFTVGGGAGATLRISGVQTTWAPADDLEPAARLSTADGRTIDR